MSYEYIDISKYKQQLIGKIVVGVELNEHADEGLVLKFADGTLLTFGFSCQEGGFEIDEARGAE